jgi:hypothetical protein
LGLSNNTTNNLVAEPVSADFDIYGARVVYDFPLFALASQTSYLDYYSSTVLDHLPVSGISRPFFNNFESEVFTQELLVTSAHDGPIR